MNEKVETATTSKLKTLKLSKYRESKKFILSSRTLWDYVLPVDPICWITDPLFSSKPQGFVTFWRISMDFVSNCNSSSEERKSVSWLAHFRVHVAIINFHNELSYRMTSIGSHDFRPIIRGITLPITVSNTGS